MPKTRPKCGEDEVQVCRRRGRTMAKTRPECGENEAQVWRRRGPTMAKTRPECGEDEAQVWRRRGPTVAKTRPNCGENEARLWRRTPLCIFKRNHCRTLNLLGSTARQDFVQRSVSATSAWSMLYLTIEFMQLFLSTSLLAANIGRHLQVGQR